MQYKKELFQGNHEPIISKLLFDETQRALSKNPRTNKKRKRYFSFLGLAACGSCGGAITAELQKGHNYYRCTKKKGPCKEPYLREEALSNQLLGFISKLILSPVQLQDLLTKWASHNVAIKQTPDDLRKKITDKIKELDSMIDRLLDGYLAGNIEQNLMAPRKTILLSKKSTLEARLNQLEEDKAALHKPYDDCLEVIQMAKEVTADGSLDRQKELIFKIGKNFKVSNRTLTFEYLEPWSLLA